MKGNGNINNLAKNRVSAIFHSRAIRGNVSPKFTELPIRMGTNMAAGNQQKHLSLSFATKA